MDQSQRKQAKGKETAKVVEEKDHSDNHHDEEVKSMQTFSAQEIAMIMDMRNKNAMDAPATVSGFPSGL